MTKISIHYVQVNTDELLRNEILKTKRGREETSGLAGMVGDAQRWLLEGLGEP